MQRRLEWIDAVKGFAIFLMVFAHAIAWTYGNWEDIVLFSPEQPVNVKWGCLWQLIYSFHMPLFFMVSGFLTYKEYKWADFPGYLKKRLTRLFLPWLFTIWIIYLVRDTMGYWFLLSLFELSIVGFFLIVLMEKINRRRSLLIDLAMLLIVFLVSTHCGAERWTLLGIHFGKFAGYATPFLFGILMRKYQWLFNLCVKKQWAFTCVVVLFALLFGSRYMVDYGPVFGLVNRYSPVCLHILGSLAVIYIYLPMVASRGQSPCWPISGLRASPSIYST